MAVLEYNNTPRQCNGLSPAQMMFGRSTRGLLPQLSKPLKNSCNHDLLLKNNERVKKQYDKKAHHLSALSVNQPVFFQHPMKKGWFRGIVVQSVGARSYIVKCADSDQCYQRNRVHIRPDKANSINSDNAVVSHSFNDNSLGNFAFKSGHSIPNSVDCADFSCYLFDDPPQSLLPPSSSRSPTVPIGSVSPPSSPVVDQLPTSQSTVDYDTTGPAIQHSPSIHAKTPSGTENSHNLRSRRVIKPPSRFNDYEVNFSE